MHYSWVLGKKGENSHALEMLSVRCQWDRQTQRSRREQEVWVWSLGKRAGLEKDRSGTSLVAQWLRIRLSMQGTRVRALVWEDPTCRRATKSMRHNY